MLAIRYTGFVVLLVVLVCQATVSFGQYGVDLNIKKPKEYQNRVLRSEKSGKKKFTAPNRFIQNTVTHYNYYFNANNKLNEVLERAKASFTDDYSQLIPFYNYSLDVTAADSTQLDSISFKAQTGIVLHDLRSDWTDNLYLLWGASYYFKKEFDSAYLMFQFINYAFAKKEKDGYYRTIGSRRDGNNAFNVATAEKNSFTRRIFTEPPSRNDAFIWQIRNHLAQDHFAEAASLIQILKTDSSFPKRLQNDLEEVQAWSYYKQKQWDSCVVHLTQALSNATNKQEKARWEYLIAQLYELTHQYKESEEYYAKAIGHTTDPIMDIYARLSSIRVNKDGGEDYIKKNIETLLKMARRDKYQDYRDIVYYMAAQMELERNNTDGALELLLKSTKYIVNNPSQRNKTYLQLAELSFTKRLYRQASNFYDSLDMSDPTLKNTDEISARKAILARAADNSEIIERQDSLQRIAALPEDERREKIRKMVRQLRRQQGLKDEGTSNGSSGLPPLATQAPPPSLFSDNSKKGEWYFYNSTSRQKGQTEFKAKWGTRPNADNWRRSAVLIATVRTQSNNVNQNYAQTNIKEKIDAGPEEISFDALNDKLPLTADLLKESNDSIQTAMYELGVLYIQELEDCNSGTELLEQARTRFPEHPKMDEILFNLYFCYNKNGETTKATAIKKLMGDKFSSSNFTTIVNTGKNPKASATNTAATQAYEKIYDLFIEGNFSEAIEQKKAADSLYSHNFWTPQLLYIEAVYYIKQRQDSSGKVVLNNIIARFPGTPLARKATTMLDVLGRRQQIEDELRKLVINVPPPDTTTRYREMAVKPNNPGLNPQQLSKDTTTKTLPAVRPPVATIPGRIDTARLNSLRAQPPVTSYVYDSTTAYYVVLVLNKVDPVFMNEAKNAFVRYNRDTYYNKEMTAELIDLDTANRLLLISPFKSAREAINYVESTRPRTATEIVPWLKGGKYTFTIINDRNLELLKTNKDIDIYGRFLEQYLPGKF